MKYLPKKGFYHKNWDFRQKGGGVASIPKAGVYEKPDRPELKQINLSGPEFKAASLGQNQRYHLKLRGRVIEEQPKNTSTPWIK